MHYSDTGSLIFRGRVDSQVEMRGLRIEISEIEYHLCRHPAIKTATALVGSHGPSNGRLVAVLVLQSSYGNGCEDPGKLSLVDEKCQPGVWGQMRKIQMELETKLPLNTVPTVWAVVKSVPLLASGKLDRESVNKWVASWAADIFERICSTNEGAREEDEVEDVLLDGVKELLRNIYAQKLSRRADSISLRKSFLSMGGDSILAMQIVSRCKQEGLQIKVADILRSASIIDLATTIEHSRVVPAMSFIKRDEEPDVEFTLSPIQQMHFDLQPAGQRNFTLSFYLQLSRLISQDQLQNALDTVMRRHSMLRAQFTRNPFNQWSQIIKSFTQGCYRLGWHGELPITKIQEIVRWAHSSLDHCRGPLVAVDVFEAADGAQTISLVAHHLAIDLVSWRIVLEDLESCLEGNELQEDTSFSFQHWLGLQKEYINANVDP